MNTKLKQRLMAIYNAADRAFNAGAYGRFERLHKRAERIRTNRRGIAAGLQFGKTIR